MDTYRHTMLVTTVLIIVLIVAVFLIFGPKDESYYIEQMVEKLQSYGISVEKIPIERTMVTIPSHFDNVYENYNIIQKKAGYDLKKYSGKTVWRYTFRVINLSSDHEVRANILLFNNRIIGGDVMSTALNGFMYPLNFKMLSQ